MIRITLPCCLKDTSKSLPDHEAPARISLASPSECSGSGLTLCRGSPNAVCASWKLTPCLAKFEAAFPTPLSNRSGDHSAHRGRLWIVLMLDGMDRPIGEFHAVSLEDHHVGRAAEFEVPDSGIASDADGLAAFADD